MRRRPPIPELRDYLLPLTLEEREKIAEACGTTVVYLMRVSLGYGQASHALARRIAEATGVPLHCIRPDIWSAAPSAA